MSGPGGGAGGTLPPLRGSALAVTAIALALGTFMQVLDSSIANVSIPTIAGNLGVSADQGTWVITSFAASNGISVPISGALMQRFGVVRTFVASVLLFTLASLLCGIAWSLPSLVLFRVIQGAVSGPMIPGSQALLVAIFPPHRRGAALAIWSMTTLIAPICGPIFGGYISDNFTWPWIFLINLPVGLICGVVSWRMLSERETPTRRVPVDRIGFALLVVWVASLQIALDKGKDADWFASPFITTLIVITAIGFTAWLIWELTDENPIVDLSFFKSRNFTIGTLAFCLGYALLFGNLVLLPLWLQSDVGYTATWAGLVAAPAGIAAVVLSPVAARVMAKVDARWTATISFVAFAISYLMRAGYTPDSSFTVLMMPLVVQGIAMSVFFVSMLTILLNGVPPLRVPAASGLSNFARITAGSFAASLTTVIWDRREAVHQSRLADSSTLDSVQMGQALSHLHALGLSTAEGLGVIGRELIAQAYLLSSIDFFWISGWLCLAVLPLVWLTHRSVGGAASAAAD
jgi:DHA2 family multidrug resistance protein